MTDSRPTGDPRFLGGRTARVLAWIALVPWVLFLLIRLLGIDFNSALVAIIGATPYVAVLSLAPVLVAVVFRVWSAAVAAVLLMGVFAVLVLPRAFGGPTEGTPPGPSLRVLAVNMMLGQGSAEDLADLVDELRPDVVSVEELTPGLADELDEIGFDEELPHRAIRATVGSQGSGLYSRDPLVDPSQDERSQYLRLLSATIEISGARPVRVSSIHTVPPTAQGWQPSLDAVPAAPEGGDAILLGDFNATIDHTPFRSILRRGWDDAAFTVGSGLVPTWPSDGNQLPPLFAIDHVLAGESIGVRSFSAHFVADTDHRAVFAELQLPGD